ncbi:MAG TPA: LamG domain-containing protein [Polyangia bacterium]|nr:LamG domain-containing protein [Polyangia bacterium]
MRTAQGPLSALLLLLAMGGCTFSPRIPAGKIACAITADCPGEMICLGALCQSRVGNVIVPPDAAADTADTAADSSAEAAPPDEAAPRDLSAEPAPSVDAAGEREARMDAPPNPADAPSDGPHCPAGDDLTTGLVAFLPMDDGGRNPVLSEQSRNHIMAVVSNLDSGTTWVPGRSGSGLSLSGGTAGGWITLGGTPVSSALNTIIDGFSFSLWAKFPKGTPADGVLISRRAAGAKGYLYRISVSGGRLRAQLYTTNGSHADLTANQTLPTDGNWMHVGGAYGDVGQGLEIFVNGDSVGKDPLFALQLGAENTPVLFGGAEDPLALSPSTTVIDHLRGALDDVAIYSRVLPPSAFKALFCGVRP